MAYMKLDQLGLLDALYLSLALFFTIKVLPPLFTRLTGLSSSRVSLQPIPGPPGESLFGVSKLLNTAEDAALLYEKWADQYGSVYKIPGIFWRNKVVLADPKANAHFFSKDTYGYVQNSLGKEFIARFFGRGLLWAEGDTHRRQRKSLSPAFSNTAIRRLISVFYDSAYKVKAAWDTQLETEPSTVIEVQKWMNRISLDSIGIAGFGHDFQSLAGVQSPVVDVFESFGTGHRNIFEDIIFLFTPIFPILLAVPTSRNRKLANLREALGKIADEMLENTRKEKNGSVGTENAGDKSIIGMLMKAEDSGVDQEEIIAQNVLLLAGYETTSISLTWALIELARAPEKQQRLRDELASFSSDDPTWDQLANGLPYLDAVVHETLRLHPPVVEINRVAAEDDVLPLSKPVTLRTGETTSSLIIPRGTVVNSPIRYMNRSDEFWGPDAKEFVPERWLDESSLEKAKDISGHKHLLTFANGPRFCLGRVIALTEFKAVLSVLIRGYDFELPQGKDTKIETHRALLLRPKVEGQIGAKIPMKVRRID